jgi:hypothetical protein
MSCNAKLIHIQIIFMHTFLCFDLWTLQPVRMWQVPLCAPTVIGPEVKTENSCRHLAAISHTSTFMQIISSL